MNDVTNPKLENPFESDRYNSASGFRSDWDVPSVNQEISDWIDQQIDAVRQRKDVDDHQKIGVLRGVLGYGKTHLFGRLAAQHEDNVLSVFVPQIINAKRPERHLQWHIVESLFEGPSGQLLPLTRILTRLLQPSFRAFFSWLPKHVIAKHQDLRDRLDEDPLAVLEIITPVNELAPYQKLADSVIARFPELRSDVLRALILAVSPVAQEARQWLRGEELSEERAAELKLGEDAPAGIQVLTATAVLLQQLGMPVVVCIDQAEAVLRVDEGPRELTNELMGWLQQVPEPRHSCQLLVRRMG